MPAPTPKTKKTPRQPRPKTPPRQRRTQPGQFPRMDLEVLARYATLALARPITIHDPEVFEYQEALDRWTFARGGRTAPGYYLDVTMFGVDGTSLTAKLKSANELMRLNLDTEYRGYRKDWFSILQHNIPQEKLPEKPLEYARVMFKIISPKSPKHLLDAEVQYIATKLMTR